MSRRDTYYAYNSLHIHVSLPAGELLYLPSRKTDYLFPGSAGGISSSISFLLLQLLDGGIWKAYPIPRINPGIALDRFLVDRVLLLRCYYSPSDRFGSFGRTRLPSPPGCLPETFPGCPAVLSNRYRRGSSYPSPGRLF